MTAFSHLLLTTAGIKAFNLDGGDILLAYLFGIGPDLDHLLKISLYYKKHKIKLFNIFKAWLLPKEKQYHWRTPLQEPISLLWIVPLSFFLGSVVPIVFFLSHLLLDYLVNYRKLPFYPFSNFATKGFFVRIPNQAKEIVMIIILLCLNLALF